MTDKSNPEEPVKPTVTFDYIKGTSFRSIRADGAIGGVTPNGHIHMAIYSERNAIPRRTVFDLDEDGKLGQLREMETRGSIVREMEVDIFLDLRTAQSIYEWLGQRIEECKKKDEGDAGDD